MLPPISLDQANVANYLCAAITTIILALRLLSSKYQPQIFDAAFFLTIFTLVVLAGRTISVHYTLTFETGNDAVLAAASGHPFPDDKLSMIRIGTIFSLVKRALETTLWWTQASVLLLFYRRLVRHVAWTKHAITSLWVLIGVSYVATIVVIFTECTPFERYWQLSPDPGLCVRAYNNTLLQCLTNILIDIGLMVVAVPVLFVQRQLAQRAKIAVLIALGMFLGVVTAVRLVYIYADGSLQPTRSFWASIQIMFTAFVANAPLISGSIKLWRDSHTSQQSRGSKPGRSTTGVTDRNTTIFDEQFKGDQGITRTIIVNTYEEDAVDEKDNKPTVSVV